MNAKQPGRSTRIVIYISFLAVSFVTVSFGVWWIVAERNEARLAGAYACGYHDRQKVRVPIGMPNGILESQCPEIQEFARKHRHRL